MIFYLPTYEVVVDIHDIVIKTSGGRPGIHVESDIRRATERPRTYTHFTAKYSLDTICALLIDSIARYHGFKDGNKRTALMTALFTYNMNGVHYKPTIKMNEDFDNLVMWVVNKKPNISEIEENLIVIRYEHGL